MHMVAVLHEHIHKREGRTHRGFFLPFPRPLSICFLEHAEVKTESTVKFLKLLKCRWPSDVVIPLQKEQCL